MIRLDGTYFPVTARFTREVQSSEGASPESCSETNSAIIITFDRISNELALTSLITHWDRSLLSAFDDFPLMVFVKDRDSKYLYVNKALANTWDFSGAGELIGRRDIEFFPSELGSRFHMDDAWVIEHSTTMLCAESHWIPVRKRHEQIVTLKVPFHESLAPGAKTIGVLGICWDDRYGSIAIRQIYDLFVKSYVASSSPGTIRRSIQFAPEYHQAGVAVLAYFGEIV